MSTNDDTRPSTLWRVVMDRFDRFLVPSAFGVLTLAVLAQGVLFIPAVRHRVDEVSGRFVEMSQPTVDTVAPIHLYLSPAGPRPDVECLVNGRVVGNFATDEVSTDVHDGDQITIEASPNSNVAYIEMDHNTLELLTPAPGQQVTVSGTQPLSEFPPVHFAR